MIDSPRSIQERRWDVVRDLALLWGGFAALVVLLVGLSVTGAGTSDLAAYALVTTVMIFAILACLVGGISRQQATIRGDGVVLPWRLFARLRHDGAIRMNEIKSIEFVGQGPRGTASLILKKGARHHLAMAEFSDPVAAELALRRLASGLKSPR